ncbi:hypothetical protein [Vibrio nigripulchritudo]|uniref:hypothetical protein n=1 Tax=Vibrio nigripulchritudo TaxID=28173 RepID=UPI0012D39A06|nr:hypothetical protein [Vibrio nigripulchritudo]
MGESEVYYQDIMEKLIYGNYYEGQFSLSENSQYILRDIRVEKTIDKPGPTPKFKERWFYSKVVGNIEFPNREMDEVSFSLILGGFVQYNKKYELLFSKLHEAVYEFDLIGTHDVSNDEKNLLKQNLAHTFKSTNCCEVFNFSELEFSKPFEDSNVGYKVDFQNVRAVITVLDID